MSTPRLFPPAARPAPGPAPAGASRATLDREHAQILATLAAETARAARLLAQIQAWQPAQQPPAGAGGLPLC